MDEKVIDYGSFIVGVLVIAAIQVLPQIQNLYANDPIVAIELNFVALVLSQIGSRVAINQIKPSVEE